MQQAAPSGTLRRRLWRARHAALLLAAAVPLHAQPDLSWIDRGAVAAGEVHVAADRGDRPLTVHVKIAAEF